MRFTWDNIFASRNSLNLSPIIMICSDRLYSTVPSGKPFENLYLPPLTLITAPVQ